MSLVPAHTPYPVVLDCIVQHESLGQQFAPDGLPLWSPSNDVGIFQINERWIPIAKNMGLDVVNSEKDNIEFGTWLYTKYGPNQWTTYKEDCA